MSPFDFSGKGNIDGEDFFLLTGVLGRQNQNGNNSNKEFING